MFVVEFIHPCERDVIPCLNGGQCMTTGGAEFTCNCMPGFSGDLCEIEP